jgi:uncharacterized membrane protein
MVMTAWDSVIDPVLSGPPLHNWIWEVDGPYFGVPIQNFAGWMATTFTVYLIYRLYENARSPVPVGAVTAGIAALPLVAHGSMMLGTIFAGGPDARKNIGPFVMGIPLAIAASRLESPGTFGVNDDRQLNARDNFTSQSEQLEWPITCHTFSC